MRIALIGAGSVSTQYLDTLSRVRDVSVVAVVDRNPDRAAAAAALLLPTPRAMASLSGLDRDTCDLVLNLTTPASHDQVTRAALERGLDVASEKPLTLTSAAADTIGRLAGRSGRTVVCAPDTVLGTGLQTARRVIDDGGIGRPVGAHAVMVCPGHERWHHRPEFFYRAGGGPLFDMGPYHLTALIQLLGAVRRVVGTGRRPRATRTIGRGPLAGTSFDAEVDTHETALLMHHDGAVSTLVMSFDSPRDHLRRSRDLWHRRLSRRPGPESFRWDGRPAPGRRTGVGPGPGACRVLRCRARHRDRGPDPEPGGRYAAQGRPGGRRACRGDHRGGPPVRRGRRCPGRSDRSPGAAACAARCRAVVSCS